MKRAANGYYGQQRQDQYNRNSQYQQPSWNQQQPGSWNQNQNTASTMYPNSNQQYYSTQADLKVENSDIDNKQGCVVFKKEGDTFVWREAPCNTKISAICETLDMP